MKYLTKNICQVYLVIYLSERQTGSMLMGELYFKTINFITKLAAKQYIDWNNVYLRSWIGFQELFLLNKWSIQIYNSVSMNSHKRQVMPSSKDLNKCTMYMFFSLILDKM